MSWESTGTITVTNGSETVTGISTLFAERCRIGDGLRGPDGELYEIVNISSNSILAISPAYMGTSKSGSPYKVLPIRGYSKKAADQLHAVLRKIDLMQGDIVLPSWITDGTPVPFTQGGTGATSAEDARTALGVDQVLDEVQLQIGDIASILQEING